MKPEPFLRGHFRLIFSLLALVLFISPTSSGRGWLNHPQTPQTPRPARPFPPPQYIPSHDYDTRNITLNLRFDWEREQEIATATITLSPLTHDLRQVWFDAANMTFASVKLAGGTPLKYEADEPNQKLRISLDRAYQWSDEITLVIEYRTNGPAKRLGLLSSGGLKFTKPSADDPTRPRQIWSQGESEYNHYWFPCFDHPNDFFTSEIYATVEKPFSVISNGKLVETKENGDGTRTFHWKMDQPHASYLSSIIVGEYTPIIAEYAGIPIITNVYTSEVAEGKVTAARLAEMVKFFSEKTGVKYPYAKYAQTMVRDFPGGMENISATTQTDNMIHDARTELDQTSDGLQSHELAHQWFGDYVTCHSWSDIWLNESFATYFQAMWDEHNLGTDDFLYLDVKGNQDQYYNAWNQGNRRPIVTRNYTNPDAVFDTYAYPRGGAVLHMLRKNLGEENWWRAINHYLRKYANQPVETEQFRIAIEEATGRPMDWFFDEWVYRMGHPVFRVTQAYDPSTKSLTLKVKQIQKIDPDSQYPQVSLFQTPVEIEIVTATGERIEQAQIEPKEDQTLTFSVDDRPLLVNFDYGDTLIKELQFNKTTDELVYQAAHDRDVLGRLWALGQLTGRLNNETTSDSENQQITNQVADSAQHDKFWGMRKESAIGLAGVKGDGARTALLAATKDQDAKVRAQAITSLAKSKDPTLAGFYQQFLGDQSYAVIRAAASALGETKSESAYPALVRLLDMPSWRDSIRASALGGLSSLGDRRAADLAFRYAAKGNRAQVRSAALRLLAAVGKDDARVFPLLSESVTEAFDKGDFTVALASAEALVALGDARGLAVFEELLKRAGSIPQLRGALTQFQQRLKRTAEGPPKVPAQE